MQRLAVLHEVADGPFAELGDLPTDHKELIVVVREIERQKSICERGEEDQQDAQGNPGAIASGARRLNHAIARGHAPARRQQWRRQRRRA
jgi:hypothetical protein